MPRRGRLLPAAPPGHPVVSLEWTDVYRLQALLALGGFEFDLLALIEGFVTASADTGVVREEVCASVIRSDKAKAFFGVEPFHSASCHVAFLLGVLRVFHMQTPFPLP